jgi:hypothetical protein
VDGTSAIRAVMQADSETLFRNELRARRKMPLMLI